MSKITIVEPSSKNTELTLYLTKGEEDARIFLIAQRCNVFNSSIEIDSLPPGLVLRRKANSYGFTGAPMYVGKHSSVLTIYTNAGQIKVRISISVQ